MIPLAFYETFSSAPVRSSVSVSGGSINSCFHLVLEDGKSIFLKRNSLHDLPDMFEAEAKGLELLKGAGAPVPEIIGYKYDETHQYLLLEYLKPEPLTRAGWRKAGEMLALIHRRKSAYFGLDHPNYMGSLPQNNGEFSSFSEFFTLARLLHQARLARDSAFLDATAVRRIEKICASLVSLVPDEPPCLVHGDLWTGNLHESSEGAVFIDPAVAYSHREADLAMSTLFGCFPPAFYEAYEEAFPPEKAWRERTDIFNLYPLLVHLNLFGQSYLAQVNSIANRYS